MESQWHVLRGKQQVNPEKGLDLHRSSPHSPAWATLPPSCQGHLLLLRATQTPNFPGGLLIVNGSTHGSLTSLSEATSPRTRPLFHVILFYWPSHHFLKLPVSYLASLLEHKPHEGRGFVHPIQPWKPSPPPPAEPGPQSWLT